MAKIKPSYKPLDLKGSEQHHDLKNQPGEKGKKDHQDTPDTATKDSGTDGEDSGSESKQTQDDA